MAFHPPACTCQSSAFDCLNLHANRHRDLRACTTRWVSNPTTQRHTVDRLPRLARTLLCRCCSMATEGHATRVTSRGRGIVRWSGIRGGKQCCQISKSCRAMRPVICTQTPDMLVISLHSCSSSCRALLHISTLPTTPPLPLDDVSTP